MSVINIKKIKKDFPIFEHNNNLVYLDSAATSQTPKQVIQAMDKYYKRYRSNIHRSTYELGVIATEEYEKARKSVAKFIGSFDDEIIFTSGATMSINMLIYSLERFLNLEDGDEVITTVVEHHSSLIPLQELCKRRGAILRHVNITENFELDYDQVKDLITQKTKIVSVALASNVLGNINDIKKIADIAHKVGAVVICDGTKVVGHIPTDVRKLDCDFMVFSSHKMCGPTGIGVLYGKSELLEALPPSVFGGGAVESVDLQNAKWRFAPWKFEAGTPNIAGAIGLGCAAKYLGDIGVQNIHKHVVDIMQYAISQLDKVNGVRIFSQKDAEKNAGVISFTVDNIHPHDIAEIAGRYGVAVRAGHHCAEPLMKVLGVSALARASFYLYNDKSDVDTLIGAIKKAQDIFKK